MSDQHRGTVCQNLPYHVGQLKVPMSELDQIDQFQQGLTEPLRKQFIWDPARQGPFQGLHKLISYATAYEVRLRSQSAIAEEETSQKPFQSSLVIRDQLPTRIPRTRRPAMQIRRGRQISILMLMLVCLHRSQTTSTGARCANIGTTSPHQCIPRTLLSTDTSTCQTTTCASTAAGPAVRPEAAQSSTGTRRKHPNR